MAVSVLVLLPYVPQLIQQRFGFFLSLTVSEGPITNVGVKNDDRSQCGRARQTNHRTVPFC